jgi:hypothetical protein
VRVKKKKKKKKSVQVGFCGEDAYLEEEGSELD